MTDTIDRRLWELGADTPELQKIIAGKINRESEGYKMPLGNIREYLYGLDISEERREHIAQNIHDIDALSVKAVTIAFEELRAALIVKEVQGEELTPVEKTYKDIDLTAFILFGIRRWYDLVNKPGLVKTVPIDSLTPGEPVEGE